MNGLTTKAARERLKQDGENELAAAAKLHPLRMFLGQFRDVMVLILLAAPAVATSTLPELSPAPEENPGGWVMKDGARKYQYFLICRTPPSSV